VFGDRAKAVQVKLNGFFLFRGSGKQIVVGRQRFFDPAAA
jgi:hypothetical protein